MKNFKQKTLAIAASLLLVSGATSAADMYIDVGNNTYDPGTVSGIGLSLGDANSTTGVFEQFGYNQLLATSIYNINETSETGSVADIFGSFYDTNIESLLTAAGVPASGTAMDGFSAVSLVLPGCPGAKCDIDALSPIVPPSGASVDSEGFGLTWDLQLQYRFDGQLTMAGPVYTGGYIDILFNDFNDNSNDRTVITATLISSNLQAANLDLFFDITTAEQGFLFIDNGSGTFVDAYDGTVSGNFATLTIDTNVNPPIPSADQLLVVGNNAIRQSELDGSAIAAVSEPATIAMMGLGLLGLGAAARRRNNKA